MNCLYRVFHYRNVKLPYSYQVADNIIDYYDLTIVKSGVLSYTINGEHILLQDGDVILLPPGTKRSREALPEASRYFSFNFYTDEQIELPFLMKGLATQEIYSLFKVFTLRYLSDDTRGQQKASNIVGYILEVLIDINKKAHQNPHIRKAIEYINNHITDYISLSSLAHFLNLSREYTAFLFKKETGMTVSQFINKIKLARACDLLREGDKKIYEIAQSLGYDDVAYFSYLFKKHYAVSPSQFAK